jgi:HPt (histidine-containing phosphotransfer) domain-containing protein
MTPSISPVSDQRRELQVLDRQAAIERFGGDRQLLRELAEIFLEDQGALLQDLRAALAGRDRERTERLAHSLKGIAANLGGLRVEAAALEMEDAARTRGLEMAALAIEPLTRELHRLVDELRRTVLAEGTIPAK